VIECKPPKDDVLAIADTRQVSTYWNRYHQVLVTNYREFLLIGREAGKPVRHEFYRLAADEREFWRRDAAATMTEHGDRLLDFLERCLRRPAPLTDPKDVAWFLASYARDARGRVEHAHAHTAMETVRKARMGRLHRQGGRQSRITNVDEPVLLDDDDVRSRSTRSLNGDYRDGQGKWGTASVSLSRQQTAACVGNRVVHSASVSSVDRAVRRFGGCFDRFFIPASRRTVLDK
jgi:hypothetical protein